MTEKPTPLDQFEVDFKAGIGREYDITGQCFLTEATRDNIKNFAEAVGDANPLWLDEEYAGKSRFKGITAPPTFLYNINHGSAPALAPPRQLPPLNLSLLYAGAELEFFRPIRLGDAFSAVKAKSVGIERKESKSLGPMLFATGEAYYYNQRQELIGTIRTTTCRFEPPQKQAVHFDRESKPGFEVKSPDLLAFEHKRRGAAPRYWENVAVGEEMAPALEKGLLTMMEIVRFGLFVSGVPRRIERRREQVEIGFSREEMQKRAGLENASDYGPQRVCWLGQFVTDWMGDDGTLKKYSCQVRHPSIMGDSNFVKGKVTAKRIASGEHLVDCEVWVENQAGLVTAPGLATIALPSKDY
ncbi:MAG: MaoC family dehydratase N-terminal domain-containing protein [Dehalococcoidales bacterium]|jgi:acyl dehydratase